MNKEHVVINDQKNYQKIHFRLKKDSDGYPPDDWEILWAYEVEGDLYSIDSIPFFVRSVAWGDMVSVHLENDELHFDKVIRRSGHSVLRVIVFDQSKVADARELLKQLGCDTELSHIPKLFSVDVPQSISLQKVLEILRKGEEEGEWEYEEACLATNS